MTGRIMVGMMIVVPSLFRKQSRFPRTLGIWAHKVQRLTRELCVTFESNSVSSSCEGWTVSCRSHWLRVCRMVRYITSFSLSLSLSLSCGLRQPATITMYGSEINDSIFCKAHTQNAQERGYVLRERLLLLLTTTACPCEKKACSQCCW